MCTSALKRGLRGAPMPAAVMLKVVSWLSFGEPRTLTSVGISPDALAGWTRPMPRADPLGEIALVAGHEADQQRGQVFAHERGQAHAS